jgi:hypothetical protein
MTEQQFQHNMRAAEENRRSATGSGGEFWSGYTRGLRRNYHGERFGTESEHLQWMAAAESSSHSRQLRGMGYLAGFEGRDVAEAAELLPVGGDTAGRGRPVGSLKPDAMTSQLPATRCSDDLAQWVQERATAETITVPAMIRKLLIEAKNREGTP